MYMKTPVPEPFLNKVVGAWYAALLETLFL